MLLSEKCAAMYERGGQHAVFAYVTSRYPHIPWALCAPCEAQSPVLDGACLVCGSIVEEGE